MVPRLANPHSLSQDVEITTRSEIAERAGPTFAVHNEECHSLRHDLDSWLRDIWVDALAKTSNQTRPKKHRKMAENPTRTGKQRAPMTFRLVSSMQHPQLIFLDPKPPPLRSREPDCEDNDIQAETRRIHALSAATEVGSFGEAISMRKAGIKPVIVETKIPLTDTPLSRPLPPLLVTEEVRTRKAVRRVVARHLQGSEGLAPSPHEPRPSCVVLPVISAPDCREKTGKKHRKLVRERPPPAYWRPPRDLRGQCMGYALGYPTSWAPDQPYVRDRS